MPDIKTDYQNGNSTIVKPGPSNIVGLIGQAADGVPYKAYTFSGRTGINDAKTILKSGPLFAATFDYLKNGAAEVRAVPVGTAKRASIILTDESGRGVVKLLGPANNDGNKHFVQVSHTGDNIRMGTVAVSGTVLARFDADGEVLWQTEMTDDTDLASVTALTGGWEHNVMMASPVYLVLGMSTESATKIYKFDAEGKYLESCDISSILTSASAGSAISMGSGRDRSSVLVATATHMLSIDISIVASPALDDSYALADITELNGVNFTVLNDCSNAVEGSDTYLAWDTSASGRKLFFFKMADFAYVCDLSSIVAETDTVLGVAHDFSSDHIFIAIKNTDNERSVLTITIDDWEAATPSATVISTDEALNYDRLAWLVESIDVKTTISVQDRSVSPPATKSFSGRGGIETVTTAVVKAISGYDVEFLVENPPILAETVEDDNDLVPEAWEAMNGGEDSAEPTNADYLAGLAVLEKKSHADIAFVDCIGATSNAMWTVLLDHCKVMKETYGGERQCPLRFPVFETTGEPGSEQYIVDKADYINSCINRRKNYDSMYGIPVCGSTKLLDINGESEIRDHTAAVIGTVCSLDIHEDFLNKPLSTAVKSDNAEDSIWPQWIPDDIEKLKNAGINTVEVSDGVGYTITESYSSAGETSDYRFANKDRANFVVVKGLRKVLQPFFGKDNDDKDTGLELARDNAEAYLDGYVKKKNIQRYDLVLTSLDNDVEIPLGIRHMKSIKSMTIPVRMLSDND